MNSTTRPRGAYAIPDRSFGLEGPVERPEPGTLPLRGDLAHIALAGAHLAGHYVVPGRARIKAKTANLRAQPRDDAEILCELAAGQEMEVLDIGAQWVWCCEGSQGPSGYVHTRCLQLGGDAGE